MKKIKVIVVEPNKEPYIKEIENSLKGLQSIVGGYIEYINLEKDVNIICNEEGKLLNLEFNRVIENDIIAGTFIIAGINNKEGETISIPKKKIRKYLEEFSLEKHERKIMFMKDKFKETSNLAYMKFFPIEDDKNNNKENN